MKKLRNYFKVEKKKDGTYRVHYRKDGIVSYITCNNKWEVNNLQKKHKQKTKKKVDMSGYKFIGGIHQASELEQEDKNKKEKVSVDQWYAKLNPEDCYVLDGHYIRMYAKSGLPKKFWYGGKFLRSIDAVKFYLVKSNFKISSLEKHPLVEVVKKRGSKQLRTTQKVLCIIPKIKWRDNRPALDYPKLNFPELNKKVVKRFWKMEHEFQIIRVGDIPKTESVQQDNKFDAKHIRKKIINNKRQTTRQRNKALKTNKEILPEQSVKWDIPPRSKRTEHTYNNSVTATDKRLNSIQRKLDKLKK